MRYLVLALIVALAALAALLPASDAPSSASSVDAMEPSLAVCAIEEGSGRTTSIAVLSTVNGPGRLTAFAGGRSTDVEFETGASGSETIALVDVAAVGTVGGLVEMPVATSAAGAVVTGSESMSAEACAGMPAAQVFISGGSTISGETFELHLMNPYAGEAVVELVVVSEAGIESNDRFESVVVPPLSSLVVDMTGLIPGRETLSITIETVEGNVLAVGRQGHGGESAVWNAVPPAQDWFIPVPEGPGPKMLLIGTPSNRQVEYQVDFYGPDGLEEGFEVGSLDPRGREVVLLAAFSEATSGVRVISTGPVVPTLWIDSEMGLAVTSGSTVEASRWMLPGAAPPAGGWATLVIMNSGIEDTTVSIRPLRENTRLRNLVVASDSVVEIGLAAADGHLVESTGPIVVLWTARRDHAGSASIGVPINDG